MSSSMSPAPGSPTPSSLSITSPADILSYVPHALGFVPRESLVILTTSGRRLGATLRVDLPPEATDAVIFAQGVLSFLQGDTEADGTLLIVYTARTWRPLTSPPFDDVVLGLDAILGAAGLPVRAGLLASDSVWRDYFCADEQCCPWPGNSFDSVVHSVLNAELIFGGSAFDPSAPEAVLRGSPALSGEGAALPRCSAVNDARAHYAAACCAIWQAPAQFEGTSALWDAVIDGAPLEPDTEAQLTGFLLASIESRTVRDFLLVSACLGSASALAGVRACGLLGPAAGVGGSAAANMSAACILPSVAGHRGDAPVRAEQKAGRHGPGGAAAPRLWPCPTVEEGSEAALLYTDVLAGRHPGIILWARVDAMANVLGRLAEVSSGEARAAALTMSAWFEYARGRGSRAAVFLDAAERAVPGYRLARLLHELLDRGGLPVWARSRSTAWTPE